MAKPIEEGEWKEFLVNYGIRHGGKRTRLGVFEIRDGVVNDLWLDDGLPLLGIDVDTTNGRQTVGLIFDRLKYSIENVSDIAEVCDAAVGNGLDIRDREGKTTALRFEDDNVESEE